MIQCFVAPCNDPVFGGEDVWMQSPVIASSPIGPLDRSIAFSTTPPIFTNGSTNGAPTFQSSTNELDRYRALFLVLGILIGAIVLRR